MKDPYAPPRPDDRPSWPFPPSYWEVTKERPPAKRDRYPMEFASVDVIEIRGKFHASQRQFARMIGINVRTLRNWEQGRRRPQGTARALLRVAAANPNVVAATLLRFKKVWWMDW